MKTLVAVLTGVMLAACGNPHATDLPPCQVEDQIRPSCRWDAHTSGNGIGDSFTVTWVESRGQALIRWDNGVTEWTRDGSVITP